MDDPTFQEAAAAFQAEAAEHVIDADEQPGICVPDGFQAEDGEHTPIPPPARSPRARVS